MNVSEVIRFSSVNSYSGLHIGLTMADDHSVHTTETEICHCCLQLSKRLSNQCHLEKSEHSTFVRYEA